MVEFARPDLLVEPDWVAAHANDPGVVVVDCATLEAYRRAHIPGAVQLPAHYYIKEDGPPGEDHGTFVMPPAQFEALMGQMGVSNDSLVVTYDDNNALVAARLWWVLKYYGHDNAKVLNGGWHRWLTEQRPVTFHAAKPQPATFKASPRAELIADAEYLKAHHGGGDTNVMDCRTDGEWAGTNSRGNKRVGRVPGAKHLEWLRFVSRDDSRKFLTADQCQALLDEAGISREQPTVTYCQGGIRAAHAAFVLEMLGYPDVRVYDGSMRDWANREDTPLEV
jgi:thiosulfate/3-mercaptopyruvate sulfurtransferase